MSKGTFTDLLNKPFRWPASGDCLFTSAENWWQNAAVAGDTFTRMVLIEDGFKRAAELLVDKAAEDNYQGSTLIYPIVFCYRHSLELALKYVIATYGRSAGIMPNTKSHDLDVLWPVCRRVIEHFDRTHDNPDLNAVEECVAEFAKIDAGSYTFRYPTNTKGEAIEIDLPPVDLVKLRETMEAIHNFFTGVDGYIDNAIGCMPAEQ